MSKKVGWLSGPTPTPTGDQASRPASRLSIPQRVKQFVYRPTKKGQDHVDGYRNIQQADNLANAAFRGGSTVYTEWKESKDESDSTGKKALKTKHKSIYPDYLVVVSASHIVSSFVNSPSLAHFNFACTFGVFHADQQRDLEFQKYFFIADRQDNLDQNKNRLNGLFELNKIYAHHLNPEHHAYYRVFDFDFIMNEQRHREIASMFSYIHAKTATVTYNRDELDQFKKSHGATIYVPTATPMSMIGGSIGATHTGITNSSLESLVFLEHQSIHPDDTLPDVKSSLPDAWLFKGIPSERGGTAHLIPLVTKVIDEGKPENKTINIEFAAVDFCSSVKELNMALINLINSNKEKEKEKDLLNFGVALDLSKNLTKVLKFTYKYEITFFDAADYDKMKRVLCTEYPQAAQRTKNSISGLAKLRWHHKFQPHVREDLMYVELTVPPLDEARPSNWEQLVCGLKIPDANDLMTNIITLPFTVYGPEHAGKTSVIGTWVNAATHTPFSWLADAAGDYEMMIKSAPQSYPEAIFHDTKFDTTGSRALDDAGAAITRKKYGSYSDFDTARLLLRDTHTAKDTKVDVDDSKYPLGMMILVLDAVQVYDELVTKTESTEKKTEKWKELVGEKFDNKKRKSKSRIDRYPPICIVLARSNLLKLRLGEPVEFEKLINETKKFFEVKHVFVMPTFNILNLEQRSCLTSADRTDWKWTTYEKNWKKDALDALQTLEQVLSCTCSNEAMLAKDCLDNHESPEQFRTEAITGQSSDYLTLLNLLREYSEQFKKLGINTVAQLLTENDEICNIVGMKSGEKNKFVASLTVLREREIQQLTKDEDERVLLRMMRIYHHKFAELGKVTTVHKLLDLDKRMIEGIGMKPLDKVEFTRSLEALRKNLKKKTTSDK